MKIALLQLNYIVGDLAGNTQKIIDGIQQAKEQNVDLCITSELALLGYPARDLLLIPNFIQQAKEHLEKIALATKDAPAILVGTAIKNEAINQKPLFNSAVLLADGAIQQEFYKSLLPTYDVFDEARYFEPTPSLEILEFAGKRIAVTICEDIWNDKQFGNAPVYQVNPLDNLVPEGVDCVINLSASPFTVGKQQVRESMLKKLAQKHQVPFVYVNQIGGNDDLIFDGRSSVISASGEVLVRAKGFEKSFIVCDLDSLETNVAEDDFTPESEIWRALVLGTRDYVHKCGFKKVLLGLSGGIDSAITAVVAAHALGKENVLNVMMPSKFSSEGSISHSEILLENLGIEGITLPIEPIFQQFEKTLEKPFEG
ncbi:MAG: NAD+ synthase (glutamine-hydrolyzing), partial [bacterium]